MTHTVRRILIVGTASGIGWALAQARAACGESFILTCPRPSRASTAAS